MDLHPNQPDALHAVDVLNALNQRKEDLNVIVTGRYAPEALIQSSDLVSRIENVKHPFDSGIPGRQGIDF